MLSELIDVLRCPRPHEDTWLVAMADRVEDRDIVSGALGCPACQSEYRIVDGAVRFADPAGTPAVAEDPELAMRIAAFLNLTDQYRVALLTGPLGSHAWALRDVTPARVLLLDPPDSVELGGGVYAVHAPGSVPLAPFAVHGAAVDETHAAQVEAIARAVWPGGRIMAPASVPVPDGVKELARDESWWVGEKESVPTTVVSIQKPARS